MDRTIAALNAELSAALAAEVADFELEDALISEGIYDYGPDAKRFERMFAVVMKLRARKKAP